MPMCSVTGCGQKSAGKAWPILPESFRLSRQGLQRRARFDRGEDESRYLNPLSDMIDRKENRASALLKQFGDGKFDAQRLFDTCRLIPYCVFRRGIRTPLAG